MDKSLALFLVPCDEAFRASLTRNFGEKFHFIFAEEPARATPEQLAGATVIFGEPDERQLGMAIDLKWLQLGWAGADRYAAMRNFPANVLLTNASGAFGHIIAEYVIGGIVALYRRFPAYYKNQIRHVWRRYVKDDSLPGKKALVLGAGDIGSHIGAALRAFSAFAIGVNHSGQKDPLDASFDEIIAMSVLDEHLPHADIVIGALPGTPATSGLLSRRRLESMKKNAILINVGRGSLLSCADLADILAGGHLRGAVLDVADKEPLPINSPLWDMENVIITPHIAAQSFCGDPTTDAKIREIFLDNLGRFSEGRPLRNVVDLHKGY